MNVVEMMSAPHRNDLYDVLRHLPKDRTGEKVAAVLGGAGARDQFGWKDAANGVEAISASSRTAFRLLCAGIREVIALDRDAVSGSLSDLGDKISGAGGDGSIISAAYRAQYELATSASARLSGLLSYAWSRALVNDEAGSRALYDLAERDARELGDVEGICAALSGQVMSGAELELARRGLEFVKEHCPNSIYWRVVFTEAIGRALLNQGEADEGLAMLHETVELIGRCAEGGGRRREELRTSFAHILLALHYARIADFEKQTKYAKLALEGSVGDRKVRERFVVIRAAGILASQGEFKLAEEAFRRAEPLLDDAAYWERQDYLVKLFVMRSASGSPLAEKTFQTLKASDRISRIEVVDLLWMIHEAAESGERPDAQRVIEARDAQVTPYAKRQFDYFLERLNSWEPGWTRLDYWR